MDEDIYEGPTDEEAAADEAAADEEVVPDDASANDDLGIDPEFIEWAKTQDLSTVRKNHERFTQTAQEYSEKERRLAPALELMDTLESDAALVTLISNYLDGKDNGEATDPALEVQAVKNDLVAFKNQIAIDRELERLHNTSGLEFDDVELVNFARENTVGSLEVALKAMKADEIAEAKVAAKVAEIKANAKAGIETKAKDSSSVTPQSDLDAMTNMTDAEFRRFLEAKKAS